MRYEIHDCEVLGEGAFTAEDIARACGVATTWVQERVEAGVLQVEPAGGEWRFDSATLVRARRIARLEASFDADPQLAALTADLIEQVAALRRRLRLLGVADA
ncbi:chaperone modulator CbpM [Caenimonas soli]|uniref:chaperone modulator CbpM n=1 Tax=Caenimonas soli TaxID=2735555 RepID=UPI001556C71F|nr:chaperone modulator CbpM [Caenimonas soli]NPC54275.1 MerR family transcriptional regulator [Caenimonas soli]